MTPGLIHSISTPMIHVVPRFFLHMDFNKRLLCILEGQVVFYWNSMCPLILCSLILLVCIWTSLVNLMSKCIIEIGDKIKSLEILYLWCKVLKWSCFPGLYWFYATFLRWILEELTERLLHGYDRIYLGHCMHHYPKNEFLVWIPSTWGSHGMLCIPIGCPFQFWSWGSLKTLCWRCMNIR